ncbi:MAG: hypothetical protein A2939_02940 [Parcubacteria group bacterium RIFCSPLOWO2_01_FULL_48_18]|nr:MAG: hypothetical protein A2939_02940 [Parcubacteria group bacterium RIFCSPLOWO2_01_FULL_48_18]OHB24468.1 MAG: hypothetical protein A3J67_05530 [Parcubacteria group bacterium RIFCSPHIGHO2_02_FULL_48_10b]
MTAQQLLEKLNKTRPRKIGKSPVVVLPLDDWHRVESLLEEYQMSRSHNYRQSIKDSRKQVKPGKVYKFNSKTGVFSKIR